MIMPLSEDQSTIEDRPKSRRFDGRHLRSERTRQLMIEAYLQLVREHGRLPTANEIAHAAGYSVRSIFERFPDLDALSLAAADFAIAAGQARRRHRMSTAIAVRASRRMSTSGRRPVRGGYRCGAS